MRTREEQIKELSRLIQRPLFSKETTTQIARKYILEAERRAEQRVRAEMSAGYIFHNPDTGTEILPYHPVESGECYDAKDIRQATAEVLKEELLSTWEEMANEYRERAERGEESHKDSERLDWLCRNVSGVESRRIVGVIADTRNIDLWREAIDAAREVG